MSMASPISYGGIHSPPSVDFPAPIGGGAWDELGSIEYRFVLV